MRKGYFFYVELFTLKYISKIIKENTLEVQEMFSLLDEIFDNNENIIKNLVNNNFSSQEKKDFLDRINGYRNNELIEFVKIFLESDTSDNTADIVEENNTDNNSIHAIYIEQKKKHKRHHNIASSIIVLGFVALLIILTSRINVTPYINNTCTIIAFLSVIVNLILKEYYRANTLKKLNQQMKQLIKDFINETNHSH